MAALSLGPSGDEGVRENMDVASTSIDGDEARCEGYPPHPSALVPPENLGDEWARLQVTWERDLMDEWPQAVGDYRTIFVTEDRHLNFHGTTFESPEAAEAFFTNHTEDASGTRWDPGLGHASQAWMESSSEFHVAVLHEGLVMQIKEGSRLSVDERRNDITAGHFPSAALETAAHVLDNYQKNDCTP